MRISHRFSSSFIRILRSGRRHVVQMRAMWHCFEMQACKRNTGPRLLARAATIEVFGSVGLMHFKACR